MVAGIPARHAMRNYPELYLTVYGCVFCAVVGAASSSQDMAWSAYITGIMAGALGAHVDRALKERK